MEDYSMPPAILTTSQLGKKCDLPAGHTNPYPNSVHCIKVVSGPISVEVPDSAGSELMGDMQRIITITQWQIMFTLENNKTERIKSLFLICELVIKLFQ